jgi:hypothetical protein
VNDPDPIACTLGESDLHRRLEQIAALGGDALIAHEEASGIHALRFRLDEETRHQLEQVVDAEASCCSFLDLTIDEREDQLVLTIAAAEGGEQLAEALALSFLQRG